MEGEERSVLEALDALVRRGSRREEIDRIAARVERALEAAPGSRMAWEPIPLELWGGGLPAGIRSSWVFVLRAREATGAERHPNSRQRMTSWRGEGDLQTRTAASWTSHRLRGDPAAPIEDRWISIPPDVWHQAVVGAEHWAVVSLQTAAVDRLVEERPEPGDAGRTRRRTYEGGDPPGQAGGG